MNLISLWYIWPQAYNLLFQANKWSVYELWAWMRERGEDPEPFWNRVKDVVIKTILCGHKKIDTMVKESVGSFYNNYNILGFDIFIDTDYRWCLLTSHNRSPPQPGLTFSKWTQSRRCSSTGLQKKSTSDWRVPSWQRASTLPGTTYPPVGSSSTKLYHAHTNLMIQRHSVLFYSCCKKIQGRHHFIPSGWSGAQMKTI